MPLARATREGCYGTKAANLARLVDLRVRTAPGMVLGVDALRTQCERLGLSDRVAVFRSSLSDARSDDGELHAEAGRLRQAIQQGRLAPELMEALKSGLERDAVYAVRSSAHGEDGSETSFAGQFDSVLGCRDAGSVARAVCRVWASLFSDRAIAYSRHSRCLPEGMAVVIQHQVDALVSGVMFTRDPMDALGDALLVEYCAGLGEGLVSGQVSPGRLRIDRQTGEVSEEATPDDPVTWQPTPSAGWAALHKMALRLEDMLLGPQDVEWSLDRAGRLYILQSRPITTLTVPPVPVVWTNANIAENYPEPVCPLLRSFVGRGYAAYFRGLGQAFGISGQRMAAMDKALDNLVGCHGGRLYYNLSNIHTVLYSAPGGPLLVRYFNQFTGAQEFPEPQRIQQGRVGQAWEILRVGLCVVWRYLYVRRGLKAFEQMVDDYADTSAPAGLAVLRPGQLAGLLRAFLEIRLERWTGAALADTAAMVSYGVLTAISRGQPGLDANELLKGLPGLASAIPVEQLWGLSRAVRSDASLFALVSGAPAETLLARLRDGEFPEFYRALNAYFDTWGFRSSGELMLSRNTPREDPLPVLRLLKTYAALEGEGPADVSRRQAVERLRATREARRRLGHLRGAVFAIVLRLAQGSIRLRERARMKQALLYTRLRHVALAMGRSWVARGLLSEPEDVLYLSMEEAIALGEGTDKRPGDARRRVAERRAEVAGYMAWNPPDSFVLPEGETWREGRMAEPQPAAAVAEKLAGIGACSGHARGHAAVVLDVSEIDRIREDQVLVTRQTDPGWAAAFFMIKGLVIERGGLLSHGAIIAREYGIPAVVGVRDATRLIADGDLVCVDGDHGEVGFVRD